MWQRTHTTYAFLAHRRAAEFVPRTPQNMRAVYDRVVEELRSCSRGFVGRIDDFCRHEASLLPVYNAFWDVPTHRMGIYGGNYAEILHLFPQVLPQIISALRTNHKLYAVDIMTLIHPYTL